MGVIMSNFVSASRPERSEILRHLSQRIQEMEATHYPAERAAVSFGIPALENLLPERQLPPGAVVELLSSADGAGAWTLALLMAKHGCQERKTLVIADVQGSFYPPAAKRLGLDLDRLIVVRLRTRRDLCAALGQSLRCPAVGAVISWCDPLPAVDYRRLQLAAEEGGGLGFFIRPGKAVRAPSFAWWRLMVAPIPATDACRRLQVDVLRCRGGKAGSSLILEIDDETGHVRLPAPVASATPMARAE
jgi:protein ImuA